MVCPPSAVLLIRVTALCGAARMRAEFCAQIARETMLRDEARAKIAAGAS